jgi:hypothetical protein
MTILRKGGVLDDGGRSFRKSGTSEGWVDFTPGIRKMWPEASTSLTDGYFLLAKCGDDDELNCRRSGSKNVRIGAIVRKQDRIWYWNTAYRVELQLFEVASASTFSFRKFLPNSQNIKITFRVRAGNVVEFLPFLK